MFVCRKDGITMRHKRVPQIVFMAVFFILQVYIEKCRTENELEHKTSCSQEILYSTK